MLRSGWVTAARIAIAAAVLVCSAGCGERPPHSVRLTPGPEAAQPMGAPAADAAVSASGTGLQLRGKPWWPAGFNAPQAATNYSINFGCGAELDLDGFFAKLPANALTRFSMFQALAVDKNTGQLDFKAADAVFAAAEKYGQVILPVLAPQDGDCDDETFKQRDWYVNGWTKDVSIPGRAVMSFRDWVRTAVNRWRSSPVLAGWELVGEPETSVCAGKNCALRSRTCPADAAAVLRRFLDESGQIVRKLDPHRLIFAGFTGGSQCGTAAADFAFVSASPQVDVVEYHDYSSDEIALPGGPRNGLAQRLRQAAELGKPLLVAEIGVYAGSCLSLNERRDSIAGSMGGQRAEGSAGALIWAYVPDPRPNECTYDVGPDDPLWSLVAEKITVG
ncbi:beta-mannosidase [Nocardia sp. NPDC051030]|uniref:beta-mannosidase n=1 Tax=Nocardia sp. NPDC051030 TaxID=3155162 RepID=UPI00342C872F